MVFIPHRLPIYFWRTPKLGPEERRAWAEQISKLGEDHFLWQFRKWVPPNPLMSQDPAQRELSFEAGPSRPRMDNFLSVAQAVIHPTEYLLIGGMLAVCLLMSWFTEDLGSFKFFAKVIFSMWAVWWAVLFWGFYRYRKWLRTLLV